MTYLSTIWPSDLRPRVIGEAIVIGRDTVLARRVDSHGLWTLDRPLPAVTARLLSAAYGKPIAEDDWCMQRFDRACLALRGKPTEADRLLRDMPHPEVAAMPELAKAAKLLKDGIAPDRLDRALRNPDLKLPRTPAWVPELALSEDGVVLGDGTVIAPLIDLPGGGCGLGIEGREAEILALLSIARREPAPPAMLTKLTVASQALARNDVVTAAIVLCQSGQPRINDWELAKGLAGAAELMADGMSPAALLKAIGMKVVKWGSETIGKYDPCEPRNSIGRWTCSFSSEGLDPGGYPDTPKYRNKIVRQANFEAFIKAADNLPDQTGTQTYCYREVFAAEGGMDRSTSGIPAGIPQGTLGMAIKDGAIPKTTTEENMTPEQAAILYRYYFDDSLGRVGGSAALDKVGDKEAAAALADTVFWFGKNGGADVVRDAVNEVGVPAVDESGRLGNGYFDKYCELAQNPETRQELLDALAGQRGEKAKAVEQDNDEGKRRILHFQYQNQ